MAPSLVGDQSCVASLASVACGVVPVATRVGGVPELITDGEDGFLEAVGDIVGQAARVASLLFQ